MPTYAVIRKRNAIIGELYMIEAVDPQAAIKYCVASSNSPNLVPGSDLILERGSHIVWEAIEQPNEETQVPEEERPGKEGGCPASAPENADNPELVAGITQSDDPMPVAGWRDGV